MEVIDHHIYSDIKVSRNTYFFYTITTKTIIFIYKKLYNSIGDKMNKKLILYITGIIILIITLVLVFTLRNKNNESSKMECTVLYNENNLLTVQDSNNVIYTFYEEQVSLTAGESVVLEYSGLLDKSKIVQTGEIIDYETVPIETDENGIPLNWLDEGIFSTYYVLADNKLKELSLDEKIGQLLLVRYSNESKKDLEKYNFSGFVFFEKDFTGKNKNEVINMMSELQKNSKIPLLTAVDEEGGKVVRISSNPNLRSEKFKSSQELYNEGGFDLISKDIKEKSALLKSLGLNLNLAPVVDVSTNSNDYMHARTIGENTSITSEYAKTVIEASKNTGVSYTLKHFPGYGNNTDTHTGTSTDTRTLEDIMNNDIPPFEAGIEVGAEAVLVSHNIVNSIDPDNPASLSSNVHNLLRGDLGFTGVVITDDIAMQALDEIDKPTLKAILAGNNLVITTDYETSFKEIKNAIVGGAISEKYVDELAFKVLAWKYYKGMMMENIK